MVQVNDTDLDQTVIVVTHPRAKSQNRDPRQSSQVHVIAHSNFNAFWPDCPKRSYFWTQSILKRHGMIRVTPVVPAIVLSGYLIGTHGSMSTHLVGRFAQAQIGKLSEIRIPKIGGLGNSSKTGAP